MSSMNQIADVVESLCPHTLNHIDQDILGLLMHSFCSAMHQPKCTPHVSNYLVGGLLTHKRALEQAGALTLNLTYKLS